MQDEEIFQTIPERAWFSQGDQRKNQKFMIVTLTQKSRTILFQYPPTCTFPSSNHKSFPKKTFPTEMKPTKCPVKEKNEARKVEEEGRR